AGNDYIAGQASAHFPTANAIQSQLGSVNTGSNAFIACLAPNGGALIYSTYLGGSGSDTGNGIAVDSSGNAYVAGSTSSVNFPTVNAFQPASPSLYSAFVAKISPANAPAASLHPASLLFGNLFVHTTSASQTITLSDMGTAPLSISQIAITGANSGDFAQTNTCGTSLTGAGSCTITVAFTPTATGP